MEAAGAPLAANHSCTLASMRGPNGASFAATPTELHAAAVNTNRRKNPRCIDILRSDGMASIDQHTVRNVSPLLGLAAPAHQHVDRRRLTVARRRWARTYVTPGSPKPPTRP